jgi:hypothetical protein
MASRNNTILRRMLTTCRVFIIRLKRGMPGSLLSLCNNSNKRSLNRLRLLRLKLKRKGLKESNTKKKKKENRLSF